MKLATIYADLCKTFVHNLHKPPVHRCAIGEWDENTYAVTPDAIVAYLIPKKWCPFDMEKMSERGEWRDPKRTLLGDRPDTPKDAKLTTECRYVPKVGGKPDTIQLLTDGTTEVWFNPKFLKAFEGEVTFKITAPNRPIHVYENGVLTGFILPVRQPQK